MPTATTTRRASRTRRAPRAAAPTGSPSAFKARAKRLRARLDELGVDAILITNPADIRYLTGFRGDDSHALASADRVVVVSDFRFAEELECVRGIADTHIRTGGLLEAGADVAAKLGARSIALQAEHVAVDTRRRLAKVMKGRRLKDTVGVLRALRAVKDPGEIEQIRRCIDIQERSLLALLDSLRPGQTETEIGLRLELEMKARGADKPAFDPIIAAGANGSLPHYLPARAKVRTGSTLLVDWGARAGGYVSDMTRTFALGRWPREMAKVYAVTLEAFEAGLAAVRPGARCRDVDTAAREVIKRAGYGPQFGHSLGHGIGLDVHESPRLAQLSDETLRPGMVVTVEPGIYLPGVGGVRIEDDVLVTGRAGESLCSLPRSIEWATR